MKTTQTLEPPIQANCGTCQYFQDFGEPNGRGWCQIFDQMARRHHFRTGDCDQEIKTVEVAQPPAPQPAPQRQSTGFSGDSVGCQLRTLEIEAIQPVTTPERPAEPTPAVESEFDTGHSHGKHDASQGWHPIYSQPATDYARGYLDGYNAVLNRTPQQPDVTKAAEWKVSIDPRWGIYQVWVSDSCIGLAATHVEAERMAQAYVANGETIKRQNRAAMKAYSLTKESGIDYCADFISWKWRNLLRIVYAKYTFQPPYSQ